MIPTREFLAMKERRNKQLSIALLCCDEPEKRAALMREKKNTDDLLKVIRSWGGAYETR